MKALIFDFDGTLVDSLYGHQLAWQVAFAEAGLPVEGWRIHRHIGMSGDLLVPSLLRQIGRKVSSRKAHELDERHGALFHRFLARPAPLPGAVELLRALRKGKIPHGIASSSKRADMKTPLKELGIGAETVVVEKSDAPRAKPAPDLFIECRKRLGVEARECYAIGDAVWDILAARRAGMLGIGVLSGGYGREELLAAGAYRVFDNTAELHERLGELGLVT